MVDMVVHRHELRETLSRLCSLLVTERKHRAGMNNVKQRRKAAAAAAAAEIKLPATPEQLAATMSAKAPASLTNEGKDEAAILSPSRSPGN